jgi:Na+(H+)/acetate symporter ActP
MALECDFLQPATRIWLTEWLELLDYFSLGVELPVYKMTFHVGLYILKFLFALRNIIIELYKPFDA